MKEIVRKGLSASAAFAGLLVATSVAVASDAGVPSADQASKLYPGKTFSPYADRSFPSKVYWGDTHLHTGLSLDAGLFGNTVGLDDAYLLAKGEQITSSTGLPVKLGR
ncbi:MAG: DUF3604 domain-containing protein, partial [Hyphomicrobiales bacterium]|nr:DUF3604 domain-containing protein [Hyphomicrobiales bacterium]